MNKEPVPDVGGLDDSPYRKALQRQAQVDRMTRHVMQQIFGESPYAPDYTMGIYQYANRLEQDNALPEGVTADDIVHHFHRQYDGE